MKTAVITGAAQGVGLATSLTLGALGYRIVMVDVQPLDERVQQLREAGLEAVGLTGDICSESFVDHLAQVVLRDYSAADVLINNAGISLIARAEDTSVSQWRRILEVNLTGPFLLCKCLGSQMLARGRGNIVNVASVAGLAGIAHRSAYNASKHGLIGLTRTLAAEWGGRGLRVNAVCPGWIKTDMDVADQGRGAYSDADIIDRVPMARFATAEDVAGAIAYLSDPERSAFVNGVTLPVDGGWIADASWESLRRKNR
jgi:NAD(P)-dependent dehydrogenase (short-subunit alcohol dehydrogenase family)